MLKRKVFIHIIVAVLVLAACAPAPVQEDPGLIFTIVASTQTAAAWQTQMAEAQFTRTPTQATLRPTLTPRATFTPYLLHITASPTFTLTPSPTNTRAPLTSWPDWKTGSVVTMEKGSGQNIGVNKYFRVLRGVKVMVVRRNGVKLRSVPNKAQNGPLEEEGSAMTLTGIMNKNHEYGWLFAQVEAVNGQKYWVGGTEGEETDPRQSFIFYYPYLTRSPTPSPTETTTPTLTPTVGPSETPTLIVEEFESPTPTP